MLEHFDITLGKPSIQLPLLENALLSVPVASRRENLPETCKKVLDLLVRLQFVHSQMDTGPPHSPSAGDYIL